MQQQQRERYTFPRKQIGDGTHTFCCPVWSRYHHSRGVSRRAPLQHPHMQFSSDLCNMLLQVACTGLLTLSVAGIVAANPTSGPGQQQYKNEPKYNYAYKIQDEKGSQEKQEQRDGIYALGRYYVQGVGSSQAVEYLADNWGFHPFIEYSNVGPHSKSITQIAFGEEAVKALHNSHKGSDAHKFNHFSPPIPQLAPQVRPTDHVVHPQAAGLVHNIAHFQQNPQQNVVLLQPHNPQQVVLLNQPPPQNQLVLINQQENVEHPPPPPPSVVLIGQPNNNLIPQHNLVLLPPTNDYLQQSQQLVDENGLRATSAALISNDHRTTPLIEEDPHPSQGLYGTKISAKINLKQPTLANQIQSSRLIESTKNLITGQDVLNINDILNQVESSTVPVKKAKNINLSRDPIVVEDIDENSLVQNENIYSTTQSTVETVNTVTGIDVTNPTIVVTPRPVGTNFLAPITAGVQLQSVDDLKSKQNVIVEIQKSVPYYLGKFEFLQNGRRVKEEDLKTNLQLIEPKPHDSSKHEIQEESQQVQQIIPQNQIRDGKVKYISIPYPVEIPQTIAFPLDVDLKSSGPQEETKQYDVVEPSDQKEVEEIISKEYISSQKIQQLNASVTEQPAVMIFQPNPAQQIIQKDQAEVAYILDYSREVDPNSLKAHEIPMNTQKVATEAFVAQPLKSQEQIQNHKIPAPLNQGIYESYNIPLDYFYRLPQEGSKPIHHTEQIETFQQVNSNQQQTTNLIQSKPVDQQIDTYQELQQVSYIPEKNWQSPMKSHENIEVQKELPPKLDLPVFQTRGNYTHVINKQKTYSSKKPESKHNGPVVSSFLHQPYQITKTVKVEVPKYIPYPVYINNHKPNPYSYAPNFPCDNNQKTTSYVPAESNFYHTIHLNDYIGLKPPKEPTKQVNYITAPRKNRSPRHSFDQNLRIEYGFMPPLIPSLEIDENGKPLEKREGV